MDNKRISQQEAIIRFLKKEGKLYGSHVHAKEDSAQGKRLAVIYGKPIFNNSLTGALATLRRAGIVRTVDPNVWVLTQDYENAYALYKEQKKNREDKTLRRMARLLAGDRRQESKELDVIGDEMLPGGSKKQKREAGCRRRAEKMHGCRALFTGETERASRSTSHSIEIRAFTCIADNTPYNLLPLRNDIHSMRDHHSSGTYPIEIHIHPEGLMMKVNTDDPAYASLDGIVEKIHDQHTREEVQKRILVGNAARGIKQEYPVWFEAWAEENGIETEKTNSVHLH